jgi:hypothetical protein
MHLPWNDGGFHGRILCFMYRIFGEATGVFVCLSCFDTYLLLWMWFVPLACEPRISEPCALEADISVECTPYTANSSLSFMIATVIRLSGPEQCICEFVCLNRLNFISLVRRNGLVPELTTSVSITVVSTAPKRRSSLFLPVPP